MAAQLNYDLRLEKGYPGTVYSQQPFKIISQTAAPAIVADGIPFGVAVGFPVTGDDRARQVIVAPTLQNFLGLSVRALDNMQPVSGAFKYEDQETVAVLQRGYVWATVVNGCVPDDAVYYDDTTGALQTTTGMDEVLIPGARWITTATAGGIALVNIQSSMAVIAS